MVWTMNWWIQYECILHNFLWLRAFFISSCQRRAGKLEYPCMLCLQVIQLLHILQVSAASPAFETKNQRVSYATMQFNAFQSIAVKSNKSFSISNINKEEFFRNYFSLTLAFRKSLFAKIMKFNQLLCVCAWNGVVSEA